MSQRCDVPGGWFVKPHAAPCPIAGWCVLELVRPAATLDELTVAEARQMGEHVHWLSGSIRKVTGCDRVYLFSFSEVHRQVHLHVVPRHGEETATAGWTIADLYRAVAAGTHPAAEAATCESTFAAIVATAHSTLDGAPGSLSR